MNIFTAIAKKFSRRSTSSNPSQWFIDWISGGGASSSGVSVTPDKALRYTPFWAATRIISGTLGSLPFPVYKRLEGDAKEKASNLPAFQLLNVRPNEYMDALTFKETRQAHALTYGNGYAEIQRTGGGVPIALWPLLPDKTSRKIDSMGVPYYGVFDAAGHEHILPDYNVLHIKGLGFDGYTGYNVVDYHKEAIGYGVAVKGYGSAFFGNDCTPGGTLEHPAQLSQPAQDRLVATWQKNHSGLSQSHRLQVLEEGMKYNKTTIDPLQAQALEVQKYTVDDCARIFNIPPHKLASLEFATFCLPADVEVYAETGNKSIADIKVGEKVWSLSDDGKWVLSPVTRSKCTGEDEILHIRTTNRAIRANARHKILIRRKYSSPRPGKGGYQYNEWKSEYIPAGDLIVGDVLVTSEKLPSVGVDQVGDRLLTKEFMEFCGLLLGDGNINKTGVQIARAENALYMDYYRGVIDRNFVKYNSGHGSKGKTGTLTRPIHMTEYERQTKFGSTLASIELTELGFSGTARTKSVPGWVFQTSMELRLSLIRGFLDADGSVDKHGRIAFSSCNENMLSQIRHLCIGCGVSVTNMRCQEGIATLPNGQRKAYKQYSFTCSNPSDNKLIGSNDPRYVERIENGKPFDKKGRSYPWFGGRGFDIEGASLSRIVSIENEPSEKVYDLEVAGTHSFIANGIVVHNSNIEEQNIDFISTTMMYWFVKWEQEVNYKLYMPSQQGKYFSEIVAAGLLRGNMAARTASYTSGRQNGYYSINDIRRFENMNPIGPAGDTYLDPMNMRPAGTIPDDPDSKSESDNDNDDLRAVLRGMICNQFKRVIRKSNAGKCGPNWPAEILSDSVRAYATATNHIESSGQLALTESLREFCEPGKQLTDSDAELFADRVITLLEANHGNV